jgi:DNA-directed RNA polymerase
MKHQQNCNTDIVRRQLDLELQGHQDAVQKHHDDIAKLESIGYASGSTYGRRLISHALPDLIREIESSFGKLTQGKPGPHAAALSAVMTKLGAESIALVTLKTVMDQACKRGSSKLLKKAALVLSIGHAIQVEARLTSLHNQAPGLYRHLLQDYTAASGTAHKAFSITKKLERLGYAYKTWSQTEVARVGLWALDTVARVTGWIYFTNKWSGKKSTTYVQLTPTFVDLRDLLIGLTDKLSFQKFPMLCKPRPWQEGQAGGFLTLELRDVATGKVKPPTSPVPLQAINNLQNVAWRINSRVLDVARELKALNISIGSFKSDIAKDVVNWLNEDSTQEDIYRYKREAREIYDNNALIAKRNIRTAQAMSVAERFVVEPEIYFPWHFDYRGRMYPTTVGVSPQGDNFEKSLLLFAEGSEPCQFWLMFHLATTYGLDKRPIEERLEWVRTNQKLIASIAHDPVGMRALWEAADEPWTFLAACIEWASIYIDGTQQLSFLPVGIDATCSGLQHLSALTLNRSAAEQVNVVPTPQPSDAYKTVAEAAVPLLPEHLAEQVDRKLTKRVVMTLPYGATYRGAKEQIREVLADRGVEFDEFNLKTLVDAIYSEAAPNTFPGPIKLMHWLKSNAKHFLKNGSISWITPSGFECIQLKNEPKTQRINSFSLGSARCRVTVMVGLGDVDVDGHIKAIAPNLVHSLDASLLHIALSKCNFPCSGVHDCVLARSSDMDQLSSLLRSEFVSMYQGLPLLDFVRQQGVELPGDLIVGDLDLEEVLHSKYLFC